MVAYGEKFTRRVRAVLALAEEEARRFDQDGIGPEHLLIGLVRERGGVAGRVLASLDVSLSRVRSAVATTIGFGMATGVARRRLTPQAEQVIELAMGEADRLGHPYLGTEHLLLGYLLAGGGALDGLLSRLGVSGEQVRGQVMRTISEANLRAAPSSAIVERLKRGIGRPPLHGTRMGSLRVNVPRDLSEALAVRAQQHQMSQSEIVRLALEQWLSEETLGIG